jgi:succinate dehydrogenase/fumarate reductase cytochrome b subunit
MCMISCSIYSDFFEAIAKYLHIDPLMLALFLGICMFMSDIRQYKNRNELESVERMYYYSRLVSAIMGITALIIIFTVRFWKSLF